MWFGALVMMASQLSSLGLIGWFGGEVGDVGDELGGGGAGPAPRGLLLPLPLRLRHRPRVRHVRALLAGAVVGMPTVLGAPVPAFFSNPFSSMTHDGTGPAPGALRIRLPVDEPMVGTGFISSGVNIVIWLGVGGGAPSWAWAATRSTGCAPCSPDSVEAEMEGTVEGIDDTTIGLLTFPDRSHGRIRTSMTAPDVTWTLHASAANGWVCAENPIHPSRGNRLTWDIAGTAGDEEVPGPVTFETQLRRFVELVEDGEPQMVTAADPIANMQVIDAMYRSAGFEPRPSGRDRPSSSIRAESVRP